MSSSRTITFFPLDTSITSTSRPAMNSGEWYGSGLGLFWGLWSIYRIMSRLLRLLLAGISFFLLKHLFYLTGISRGMWLGDISRFQILAVITYISANAVRMALGVSSLGQLSSRAALLATFNLIPLFAGSQLSLAADSLGISLRIRPWHFLARLDGSVESLALPSSEGEVYPARFQIPPCTYMGSTATKRSEMPRCSRWLA